MRQSWDETWQQVASAVARRSACVVRQVGVAIVTADNRDHWVGYNGPPAGWLRGDLGGPDNARCGNYCPQGFKASSGPSGASEAPCVSIHAEINALMQSDRSLRKGGTAYVTAAPCWKCGLALANSGLDRLICPPWEHDRSELGARLRGVFEDTRGGIQVTTTTIGW